jgi:hypothetical protein
VTNNENQNKSNIIKFPAHQEVDNTAEIYGLTQEEVNHLSSIMDTLLELPDEHLNVLYCWIKGVVES